MNRGKQILINASFGILLASLLTACVEFETVSEIPEITYKEINVEDATDTLGNAIKVIQLSFDFIDGDADIGVYEEIADDESYPDSVRYGLFIDLYERIDDSTYQKKYLLDRNQTDTLTLNQLIEYDEKLDRVGQNKTVKGNIQSNISVYKTDALTDSVRFEFYIRDRALHKSNIETTDNFFVSD